MGIGEHKGKALTEDKSRDCHSIFLRKVYRSVPLAYCVKPYSAGEDGQAFQVAKSAVRGSRPYQSMMRKKGKLGTR